MNDKYNRKEITISTGINILLQGNQLGDPLFVDNEDINKYNMHVEQVLGLHKLNTTKHLTCSVDEFHEKMSSEWFMPPEFKNIDIDSFILNLCDTDAQKERVLMELKLFQERDLYNMLRFMIYFVSYMRENCLIWGVGRGSSVASYVLFLIGVHKVDSLKYNLDIKEFLK